jgi:hypothetical protein
MILLHSFIHCSVAVLFAWCSVSILPARRPSAWSAHKIAQLFPCTCSLEQYFEGPSRRIDRLDTKSREVCVFQKFTTIHLRKTPVVMPISL